ncbi:hypothetical protein [Collimonas sp.]|jgi:hypothetical protein|uniref:hypothetical protein n=1 Tax=Collimonas sp. TaxID=1963772 RepID=UPI0037C1AE5F
MLYSISSSLSLLFAAIALFLPFSALYVKFRYVQYARIYTCLYRRPAYNQKRVVITKLIETALYALCAYCLAEVSEFERTQQSVLSTAHIGQPTLVAANTYLFYADERQTAQPRACKIFVNAASKSRAAADPCSKNAPIGQQKGYDI